jgi:hypothetical protein
MIIRIVRNISCASDEDIFRSTENAKPTLQWSAGYTSPQTSILKLARSQLPFSSGRLRPRGPRGIRSLLWRVLSTPQSSPRPSPIWTGMETCSLLVSNSAMTASLVQQATSFSLNPPASSASRANSALSSFGKAITTCPVGLNTPNDVGNFARLGLAIFIPFPGTWKINWYSAIVRSEFSSRPKRIEADRIRLHSLTFCRRHHDDGNKCLCRSGCGPNPIYDPGTIAELHPFWRHRYRLGGCVRRGG